MNLKGKKNMFSHLIFIQYINRERMMVDCTSFHGVGIVTVYSGVLMVATSILPLINFLVTHQYGLIQYINLECAGYFL